MNFKIVEGNYADIQEIYPFFEEDYLHSDVYVNELKGKYGLSHREFKELCALVKKNNGINRRPRLGGKDIGKNYYKSRNGFIIQKKIGANTVYLGFVKSEELAIKLVELCKKAEWDIDVCRKICKSKCDIII